MWHGEGIHTDWNQLLGRVICISAPAEFALIESLSYLFVCFSPTKAFPGKTGHYACVSLDHVWRHKPTSRRSQIEWCLISKESGSGQECQLASHCARANQIWMAGSRHCVWGGKMTAQAYKTLSTLSRNSHTYRQRHHSQPRGRSKLAEAVTALICKQVPVWAA